MREARCPAGRRHAGSQPLRLASSLHRPSSPTASLSLSGSRAAAHMVPCQIPGRSLGHVSGSQQRRRSRVTMETEANGRPVLSAGGGAYGVGLDLGVARRTNELEIWVWFVCHSKEDQTCGSPQCGGRPPVLHHVVLMTSFLVLGIALLINSKVKIQEFYRTRLHVTSHPESWTRDQTLPPPTTTQFFSMVDCKLGWCEALEVIHG